MNSESPMIAMANILASGEDMPITMHDVYLAVLLVTILMIVLSVPTKYLTVRSSAKLIKKYIALRSIDKVDENKKIPKNIMNEWNAAKSTMGYITLINEQLEKLSSLRPLFFQAELAVVLSIIVGIAGHFEENVWILFAVVDGIAILGLIYGGFYTFVYKREYLKMLKELNEKADNGAADGMYG